MITVCLKVELIAESFNKTHVKEEEVNMSEHVGDRRASDSHLLGALIGRENGKMEMLKTVLNCVPWFPPQLDCCPTLDRDNWQCVHSVHVEIIGLYPAIVGCLLVIYNLRRDVSVWMGAVEDLIKTVGNSIFNLKVWYFEKTFWHLL